jgi:hypothetical protein
LDVASLRHFEVALESVNLKSEAALAMSEKTCQILGVEEVQELIKVRLNRADI